MEMYFGTGNTNVIYFLHVSISRASFGKKRITPAEALYCTLLFKRARKTISRSEILNFGIKLYRKRYVYFLRNCYDGPIHLLRASGINHWSRVRSWSENNIYTSIYSRSISVYLFSMFSQTFQLILLKKKIYFTFTFFFYIWICGKWFIHIKYALLVSFVLFIFAELTHNFGQMMASIPSCSIL